MALSPVEIRQAVAASIAGTLGPDGWRESPWAYDLFGRSGRELRHLEYAVGVPQTTPTRRDEQRRSVGANVLTTVSVRWSYALQADGQVAGYDTALLGEAAVIDAVLAVGTMHPELVDVTRRAGADGVTVTGQLDFVVPHLWVLDPA